MKSGIASDYLAHDIYQFKAVFDKKDFKKKSKKLFGSLLD
jgi:hypothetical protein